jgi:hypothetical protein
MNVRGTLIEATADDLIHKTHDAGFFVLGFIEHGDFVLLIFGAPIGPATQDLLKRICAEAVEFLQALDDARARSHMPHDGHRKARRHTLMRHEVQRIKGGDVQCARSVLELAAFGLLSEKRQQTMPQRDLSRQQAADASLSGLVVLFGFPPRQRERFGQCHEEIPLSHAFAIQHGIDEGGLIKACVLDGLPDSRRISATRGGEDVVNEGKHGKGAEFAQQSL